MNIRIKEMEIFLKDLKYAIKRAKGQINSKYDNEKKIFDNAGELFLFERGMACVWIDDTIHEKGILEIPSE